MGSDWWSGDAPTVGYIAEVDAICRQAAPGIVNLGSPPADPVAGITWYAEQARLHRELLTVWANVRCPEEDDALIRQILDPLEQSVMRLSYASQALAQGGLQLANEHIGKAGDLRSEYRSKARAYGFRVCYAL
jgi:hypothetical protein